MANTEKTDLHTKRNSWSTYYVVLLMADVVV